jgi:hypothetical protein
MKDQTNEEPLDPMPGELPVTAGRPGTASAQHAEKHGAVPVDPDALFRQVLDGANLNLAWKQVKANQGAAGVDGMTIDDFPAFAREHWERIRSQLSEGNYHPVPVRRVFIPKPDGSQRPLGIPTVLDRVIQQAIAQVYATVLELDEWIRRRVRLYHWKQWKRPRARRRNLIKLGIKPSEVYRASRSRKGYWRMSQN